MSKQNMASDASISTPSEAGPPPQFIPKPIIGPDGRELPRPVDQKGKPLPIYSTEDGKPILDPDGRPIPVMFDQDGNPLPPPSAHHQVQPGEKPFEIPKSFASVAFVDLIICLLAIVALVIDIFSDPVKVVVGVTLAMALLGALSDISFFVAINKSSKGLFYAWAAIAILLLIVQAGVVFHSQDFISIAAVCYCLLRAIVISCVFAYLFCFQDDHNSTPAKYGGYPVQQQSSMIGPGGYPVQAMSSTMGPGGYPQQQQNMQSATVVQPYVVASPPPMYGGGYYGGGGYGGGPGYGYQNNNDALMMAMMAHQMGHHHHHYHDFYDHHHGAYGFGGGYFM